MTGEARLNFQIWGIVGAVAAIALIISIFWKSSTPPPPARQFSQENLNHMQAVILNNGFTCVTPLHMRDMLFSGSGFVVQCEGRAPNILYWFDVEDQGGKWIVKAR